MMAEGSAVGFSLHLRATNLINDFLKETEGHFQYLQEILAEAKEHFGRRDSVHLLPKTPCTKAKRRRIKQDSECLQDLGSSPIFNSDSYSVSTPEPNNISCGDISGIEPVEVNETKKASKTTKTRAKQKAPTNPKRKQPRRGAKKVSETPDDSDIKAEKIAPKRSTRSTRKQSEKDTTSSCILLGDNIGRTTQNKRKGEARKIETECQQVDQTLPEPKKTKLTPPCMPKTPQNAEVFIPETPQNQQVLATTPTIKEVKNIRSSIKVVLSPVVASPEQQEVCAYNVLDKEEPTNKVFVVDAVSYEEEKANVTVQDVIESNCSVVTPEKHNMVGPTSDATVSSTQKLKGEARLSVTGTKRKQNSTNNHDKKARILSPLENDDVHPTSTATQEEKKSNSSSSDEAVVSSTTDKASPKPQRKSKRFSKRCSRQSMQSSKAGRKSTRNTRNSKSLLKSSVMLKLSAKKLMPSIRKDELSVNASSLQVNLLEEFESSTSHNDSNEELCHANVDQDGKKAEALSPLHESYIEDISTIEEQQSKETTVLNSTYNTAESPVKHENKPDGDIETITEPVVSTENENEANLDSEDLNNTQSTCQNEESIHEEEEVFHDTIDSSRSDDEFHDAPEPVAAENLGVATRTSSSNQSTGSSDNGKRSDSGSSDDATSCKQSDEDHYQTQSSPEPSQENCIPVENQTEEGNEETGPFGFTNKQKNRQMKLAIMQKQEKEKERLQKLDLQKQKKIEDLKRRREEKVRKVAELRAAKAREQNEKKEQLEKREEMRKLLEGNAKKVKEREEEMRRKARQDKKAECDARRKQEEEQRKQKLREKEEEMRKHREMMQRKAEYEEQERQRKIQEAKRQQEFREQELQRAKEIERQRALKEREENERKAKEEKEKQQRRLQEDKEREEREKRRIAALLKEKEEQDRKEKARKAKEDELRKERELKYCLQQEQEKERQRLRKLQEQREAEEARVRALRQVMNNSNNYEMTPPPPPRVKCMSTTDNYNINDICSDDSTDDEDAPKKKVPQWALGAKLKAALLSQCNTTMAEIEAIFGGITMPNLDDIFTQKKRKRFYQRTSSAHWDTPPLKPINKGTLI